MACLIRLFLAFLLAVGSALYASSVPAVEAAEESFVLTSRGYSLWLGTLISGYNSDTHKSDDIYHEFESNYWMYEPQGGSGYGIGYYYTRVSYNFSTSGIPPGSIVSIEVVGEAHRDAYSAIATLSIYNYHFGLWEQIGTYGTSDSNIVWSTSENVNYYLDSETREMKLEWYLKTHLQAAYT